MRVEGDESGEGAGGGGGSIVKGLRLEEVVAKVFEAVGGGYVLSKVVRMGDRRWFADAAKKAAFEGQRVGKEVIRREKEDEPKRRCWMTSLG